MLRGRVTRRVDHLRRSRVRAELADLPRHYPHTSHADRDRRRTPNSTAGDRGRHLDTPASAECCTCWSGTS